ncbi:hypothetical protein ACFX1Q_032592 [Malus domestica]
MEKFFNKEWKVVGIYDAIKLLTIKITMDKELLMAALGFWCSTTNTMVLPLGLIGPTVLDISAIFRSCIRTSSTTTPSFNISLAEGKRVLGRENTKLFFSIGITNSFAVPNHIKVWSRTCWSLRS